jgi:trimethylamine--corrinoid protein Co-methyltransferase
MLNKEQCEAIHRASLEILRRTGVRIHHAGALDLLRQTDAAISDEESSPSGARQALVRLPPGQVEWALSQAPSRIALCRRGSSEVAATLEGTKVSFGPGSDCPNYLDPRSA